MQGTSPDMAFVFRSSGRLFIMLTLIDLSEEMSRYKDSSSTLCIHLSRAGWDQKTNFESSHYIMVILAFFQDVHA
jgi:hypothetical protein